MQKKLITLAVASLASGAAFAQASVTMYGVADAGYVYSSGSAAVGSGDLNFSGVQSGLLSGSRFGLRGEEALGNSLKAIFTLEYSLNIDNNSGAGASSGGGLAARQQFIGLSSATAGTVTLGRQYAPGYQATQNNDPMGGAAIESQSYLASQAGNSITPSNGARWNNTIAYTSPNWSGFSFKGIYSFGETGSGSSGTGSYNTDLTSVTANQKFGLGFNYANGPLNIDLVYQSRMNATCGTVNRYTGTAVSNAFSGCIDKSSPILYRGVNNDINEAYIGASYDFRVVKIMGSYQEQNDKNAFNLDNNVWSLGAVIPVMVSSNIHLGYSQLSWDQNNCNVLDAGIGCGLTGMTNSATLAWTTALSKRTTLYAAYVWNENDKNALGVSPSGLNVTGARNETNNTFAAGIRHTF